MVGGLGICGRPFCCASFLDDFQPVSIKMAKTQNLSLNPTKISGTCGRLMCCLKYEQDTYESLIRSSPKVDSFVDTPEGRGTVVESEILRQRVKVQMENDPDAVHVFSNEDIAILRNGKAKKNDPPIPADLAPISGSGKRPEKPREQEAPVLEPIRFRYRTEAVVEEVVTQEPQPEAEQRPSRSRRRRGRGENRENPEQAAEVMEQNPEAPGQEPRQNRQRRDQRRRQEQPRSEKPEKQENPEQPKEARPPRPPKKNPPSQPNPEQAEAAPTEDGEAKKPRRRPNHYRHRKPKTPQA